MVPCHFLVLLEFQIPEMYLSKVLVCIGNYLGLYMRGLNNRQYAGPIVARIYACMCVSFFQGQGSG